jgi:hypothetical protein
VLHPQFVEKSVKAAQARKLGAQFDATVDQGPQVSGQGNPSNGAGFSVGRAISGTTGENDVLGLFSFVTAWRINQPPEKHSSTPLFEGFDSERSQRQPWTLDDKRE